jgi:hypothetical protein
MARYLVLLLMFLGFTGFAQDEGLQQREGYLETCPWRNRRSSGYRQLEQTATMFLPPVAIDTNDFFGA